MKIKTLGNYNLEALEGWLPITDFCNHMPFDEKNVRYFRKSGKWLDGVVTKSFCKSIWVNVWEVLIWLNKEGLTKWR